MQHIFALAATVGVWLLLLLGSCLLGFVRGCWMCMLAVVGCSWMYWVYWMLLGVAGVVGRCWVVLDVAGCYWVLLDVVGSCCMLRM